MKIIILLCFFSGLTASTHPRDNCWLLCDPKDYLAVVTCSSVPDNTDACTCVKRVHPEGEDGDCAAIANVKDGPMTWNECHALAGLVGTDGLPLKNKFFRWEDKETDEKTLCYFIDGPCTNLPPADCMPYDNVPCVAGPSDEACEPETSVSCGAPEWKDEGFHWICVDHGHLVNAYATTDNTIPKGTTCDTGKLQCLTWEWEDDTDEHLEKRALVKCGETLNADGDGTGIGIWESNPAKNMLVDIPIGEDGTPLEPIQIIPNLNDGVCRCPLLEISEATYNTPGLSLLCDLVYNPADGGIKFGNACTLLCDGHFKMYIECFKGQWKNTGADYPFPDVAKEDINC